MPGVTDQQIAAARSVDLLSYLQDHELGSIKKSGKGEYCLVEHDSLKISHGKWFWFSRGIGNNNALDFLVQVRGMRFVDAVNTLADGRAIPVSPNRAVRSLPDVPRKPFVLPEPYRDNFRAISYLMGRGIDRDIIDLCIKNGSLFEGRDRHDCVFVGEDKEGKVRFACKRATNGDYKKDVSGSDKRYSFSIPSREPGSRSLFVFEAPIDLMAQATLDKRSGIGAVWDCFHRLSLGGVSPLALMEYVKTRPEINCVSLHLDNDLTGREAALRIKALLESTPHPLYGKYNVNITPPPTGKDYGEHLQNVLRERKPTNRCRSKDAAISL